MARRRYNGTITVKLDYDTNNVREILERMSILEVMIGRMFEIESFKIKRSPSKRGYHVKLLIKPLVKFDKRDIVILQLLLGSDRKREFFNWLRVRGNLKHWNVLFDKKLQGSVK